ncbi:hypothetical protein K491DRAFT_303678 [Lophiostoma macrostomum CBS 122681]|uniref:Uncharacterized protein n=1 Tax=Lophiostoma macrostomum CBS 122681 TaxID=1314788 RepID=A0A6A6TFB9_9PLEO|nr:hypothetical protein K491DRAFT_303678 [Lophiostoma macrostomum CBS 122681]
MMLFRLFAFAIYALHLRSGSVLAQRPTAYPYALTFGLSSITASRITTSGEIEIVRRPASIEYQTYVNSFLAPYGESIPDDGYRRAAMVKRSSDAENCHPALAISQQQLDIIGQAVEEMAGSRPQYRLFTSPPAIADIVDVVAQEALLPQRPIPRHMGWMAITAYDLQGCASSGRTLVECQAKRNDFDDLVLLIEYEEHYLGLHLLGTEYIGGVINFVGRRHSRDLGEARVLQAKNSSGHAQDLRNFIGDFINDCVNAYEYYQRLDIRTVVAAGTASPDSVAEVLDAARDAIGHKVQVLNYINPGDVIARGAAIFSQLMIDGDPQNDMWRDWFGTEPREEVEKGRESRAG